MTLAHQVMVSRAIDVYGDRSTVWVRRRHTLHDPVTGTRVDDLEVVGSVPAGAESLTLRRASGARLRGRVPAGVLLDTGTVVYGVASDVDAVGELLTDVPITEPVEVPLSDADELEVMDREFELRRVHASRIEGSSGGRLVRISGGDYLVAALGAALPPREGDALLEAGDLVEIGTVETWGPSDPPAGWVLRRRAR